MTMKGRPYPPSSGTQQVALASSTPGTPRKRSTPSRISWSTAADFANCGPLSDMRIVSTFSASKPGFTAPSAIEVRISRAEPTSSTTASATSLITSMVRALFWRSPVPERPPLSLRVALRSGRELCSAGIRPNRMPVNPAARTVNASTRQSTPTSEPSRPTRGRLAVFTLSRARIPTTPNAAPATPPASESSTLSVSSCRMMRPRPAPMAARIAISRRRPTARASSRFATLAQAISSTKLTAPTRTRREERTLLTRASRIGSTLKAWFFPNAFGYFRRKSSAESFSLALAWARVTPGFKRPAAWK